MGHELYRMICDGAPPSWTTDMRLVALMIADDARDPSQGLPEDGGWPWSAIPVSGGYDHEGQWHDGITERTGLNRRAVSRALTGLARAGYEMREALGRGKDGRVVFTAPERGMRFRVPPLAPREPPERPPDVATDWPGRSPIMASVDSGNGRQKRRNGRQKRRQRSPGVATHYPQIPPIPSSPHPQVVNSYLEGDRPAAATKTTTKRKIPTTDIPEAQWVCSGCGAKAADGVRFARPPDLCAECAAKAGAEP